MPDEQTDEPPEQVPEETPKQEAEKSSSSSSSEDETQRRQKEIEKFNAKEQKKREMEEAKKAREREELEEKEKINRMNREKMQGIDTTLSGKRKKKTPETDKEPLVVFQGGSKGSGFPEVKFEDRAPPFDPDSDVLFKETLVDMTEPGAVKEEREQYDNLFQYLLACIGFAVGLGESVLS